MTNWSCAIILKVRTSGQLREGWAKKATNASENYHVFVTSFIPVQV